MILLNADAAEGSPGSPLDLALLEQVDALNLALGGHAGVPDWTRELAAIARRRGRRVHLHPGYPDRENFGRVALKMPWEMLAASLSEQRAVLPEVTCCKFHGALYNEAVADAELAQRLANWCVREGIAEILAPPESELAKAAARGGLGVLREGFIDRAYLRDAEGRLALAPRSAEGSVLGVEDALGQARQIVESGTVPLLEGGEASLCCETLCLHGDGPHALEIARRLREEVLS